MENSTRRMRPVLLFAILFVGLAVIDTGVATKPILLAPDDYSFAQFVREYNKEYDTENEFFRRKKIFEENLHTIVSHNSKLDNVSQKGHVLGINEFADLLPEELPRGYSKMMATRRYQDHSTMTSAVAEARRRHLATDHHFNHLPFSIDPQSSLPQHVDWRKEGVTTPVKSQGACGSCWAFASTAVLESHIAIQTGTLFSLSEQELVSCAKNPRHCGGTGGCTGATAEIAFDLVMQKGMVQEWDFGYQSYHGEAIDCTLKEQTSSPSGAGVRGGVTTTNSTLFKGAVATIDGYVVLPSNKYLVLMNAVAKLGPVTVSVACLPWHLYQGGIFYAPLNTTRATDVDHLVVLEGYGTDENTGEDYWLVRNSWGPLWGESGYIRLLRVGEEHCGMDKTTADGVSCTIDENGNKIAPPDAKICGNSGILYDTAVPLGGHLL